MNEWINKVHQGHVLDILKKMPSESIDCVITSPPYWALRDYQLEPQVWDGDGKCEHNFQLEERKAGFCSLCSAWRGELGIEPTFDLYIKHLCDIFDEIKRVLKKTGTCWVNLGDTYSSNSKGDNRNEEEFKSKKCAKQNINQGNSRKVITNLSDKSLCLIPQRFAIGMVERGWILRNQIIWWKRNCMPSSVKDRFTVDYELIFFFVKNKKYWFEMQYEPVLNESLKRAEYGLHNTSEGQWAVNVQTEKMGERFVNPQGRNKRCVWDVTTKGFSESHFAVFPEALIKPMIKAGCPEFICKKCGKAREKIYKVDYISAGGKGNEKYETNNQSGGLNSGSCRPQSMKYGRANKITQEIGYTDCGHNAGWTSGIVLDPFIGSGTTGLVAKKLERNYIGIELNSNYIKLANERINGFQRKDWKAKKKHKILKDIKI